MKKIIVSIRQFCSNCFSILEAVFAVLIFSRFKNSRLGPQEKNKSSCYVLGNGPSLETFIHSYIRKKEDSIYVVNFFCLSEVFSKIKPNKYVFVDSSLYTDLEDERVISMLDIFSKIDWSMTYYFPAHYSNSKFIKRLVSLGNPNLDLQSINVTPVDGPLKFRNFIYRLKLGMPKCYNVLNASLCCAINDGYQTIYIAGADHSWLSQLFFDDKGNLCTRNEHFYHNNDQSMFIMPKGSLETGLFSFANALKSYRYINDYANSEGVTIYNLCKQSYIDIFEKL